MSKTTGNLYQTHRILEEPVAKYLCEYISREPKYRAPEELPTHCRIGLKLFLKMDSHVPPIIDTIGKFTRHLQSLRIDRSKSHQFPGENKKTDRGVDYDLTWSHQRVIYPQPLVPIRF